MHYLLQDSPRTEKISWEKERAPLAGVETLSSCERAHGARGSASLSPSSSAVFLSAFFSLSLSLSSSLLKHNVCVTTSIFLQDLTGESESRRAGAEASLRSANELSTLFGSQPSLPPGAGEELAELETRLRGLIERYTELETAVLPDGRELLEWKMDLFRRLEAFCDWCEASRANTEELVLPLSKVGRVVGFGVSAIF